jgi:two-component system sensor histidine kinase/response regulator
VSVVDTGVGIQENAMENLFSLDDRLTTRGTNDEKGSGLGLVLCKEFVEKNGGRIFAKSEPGKGSTFSFTLPLVID